MAEPAELENAPEPDARDVAADLDESIATAPQEEAEHIVQIEIVKPPKTYAVGMLADMEIVVSCPEKCDLVGGTVLIGDADDQIIAEQYLEEFVEQAGANSTGVFQVPIPAEPGQYVWNILFYPPEDLFDDGIENVDDSLPFEAGAAELIPETDGLPSEGAGLIPKNANQPPATLAPHAIVQAEYSFTAAQHITGMAVWRDSNPIIVGSEFELNVGINCLEKCSLLGQKVNLYLNDELLATLKMGEPQAPRNGLYFATARLTAPDEVAVYTIDCRMEPEGLELLHKPVTSSYSFATGLAPQVRLRVYVGDIDSGEPIDDVHLTARAEGGFPYRARTNEAGEAWMDLPWGDYKVQATTVDHRDTSGNINLVEGMESAELRLEMIYFPDISM